jgi:hypothetical protein
MASAAFALYDLYNTETGVSLYRTYATQTEILAANANLRDRGLISRFYPAGTYHAPSLHDPR